MFCLGLFIAILSYGKYIIFQTADRQPLADVSCVGYSAANDSIASWISDKNGAIDINRPDVNYIVASRHGFSEKMIYSRQLDKENNIITLSAGTNLNEVVVTPSDVEEFVDHTSYRISEKDMARYTTVLQSLNEIPNMTVLTNGSVFFEGNSNIKILLDGVDASLEEIRTLSKEDIAKVDVYQTPPARFLSQGVSAVIDIRLKSKIYGGNVAVDVNQAFQSLMGNNSAALYYNYRQSRFSLLYNNDNKHYRKYRQSEVLDYDFGGVNYNKVKKGRDSKSHLDDNNINLSYQINKPKNFLYNVKAQVDFNRNGEDLLQDVKAAGQSFLATNSFRADYTKYLVGNYFEKNLGDRYGTFLANINYQHHSTFYRSAYDEKSDSEIAVRDSYSKYKTHLNTVVSEIQYALPYNRLGYFSASIWESYKHSKYVDSTNPFFQKTNSLGGSLIWRGWKDKFQWLVSVGTGWNYASSINMSKPYNQWLPNAYVILRWRPSPNVSVSGDYSFRGYDPSIAQLSETNQWLDTRLVYHGNSILQPYKTHSASLHLIWNNRYVNLAWYNRFTSSPGMICDMYTETENYMLQTLVNLSQYREWLTQLDMSLMPLGNNKLVFWTRVILADLKGKNREYSWDGYRYQWMTTLSLNLEHWTAELYYQYPGKVVQGQLERPRAQCWSASVFYRPMTNLSVGVEWFMPFGNGFKESERTVNNAPVHANTELNVMDRNNMVSIKLSYNFNFGRNRNQAGPRYDNYSDDSGILRK